MCLFFRQLLLIRRWAFAWLAILLAAACTVQAAAKDRVALVVGNSIYRSADYLPNAARDAQDVSEALRQLGFQVYEGIDLSRSEILRLTERFAGELDSDDVALFYFSGHGIQIGAENYILPGDAAGNTEEQLRETSIRLQSILREMELRAGRNIIILDACRNNPFEVNLTGRSLGVRSRGLARVEAGVGSYIAFSTQPGNIALDGDGRNSPFTGAMLTHLRSIDDDLHEMMRKVRLDVVTATNRSQIPWENSSLIEQVYLGAPGGRHPRTSPNPPQPEPQATRFTHAVSGLDPNGDGFLALRSGTSSRASRLAKMTEGTRLQVLEQSGVWFHVRTETGLQGWAHSNWIRFTGASMARPSHDCDSLWYERNSIFARNGYCFQSARGRAAFSNVNCRQGLSAGQIPLTASERRRVNEIVAQETALGCR